MKRKWRFFFLNFFGPAIVDVVASIAVIGEAGSEAGFGGQLPDGIGLAAANSGDPAGAELHRHAAESLLPDPAADSIGGLEDHDVVDAVLGENLRRRDTLKIEKIGQSKKKKSREKKQ